MNQTKTSGSRKLCGIFRETAFPNHVAVDGHEELDNPLTSLVDTRKHTRYSVRIRALLYYRNHFKTITIVNISSGGARIEGVGGLMPGDQVELSLLNGRRLPATVRWWLMGGCGLEFKHALASDDQLFSNDISNRLHCSICLG